jgi:hypothetical protein
MWMWMWFRALHAHPHAYLRQPTTPLLWMKLIGTAGA